LLCRGGSAFGGAHRTIGGIDIVLEKGKIEAKPDLKLGVGISGGTTQTATGPVIPWSQILPQ
jgi:hypothetical protein